MRAPLARSGASDAPGSPSVERHPDGVVLEPPPALPSATTRAQARGVVALREPRGDDEVQKIVRAFIEGFEHESIEELMRLLTQDAAVLSGRFRGQREVLVRDWQMRMNRAEYAQLAGLEVYRPEKIQHFEFDETDDQSRPSEMRPGDLLVRVPIDVTRLGSDTFFADMITLLLRAEDGHLKICGYGEGSTQ